MVSANALIRMMIAADGGSSSVLSSAFCRLLGDVVGGSMM
jgi:hypothetical protein